MQEPDIRITERCLPNPNVRRCLETSRIGPHRLVLAKGIEGAELSGGAVIVSEGGQCHITVLPDELKNLLHADYYELTLWADGADGKTIAAKVVV